VQLLLDANADVNAVDTQDETPLLKAAAAGHTETCICCWLFHSWQLKAWQVQQRQLQQQGMQIWPL
jgi:hypothetical protein